MAAEKYRIDRTPFRPLPLSDRSIVTFIWYIARDPGLVSRSSMAHRDTAEEGCQLDMIFRMKRNIWRNDPCSLMQDAPAAPLGRLTLVSAPTAVRLRVVGLPGPITSAVKATG
jgi:hypothetical protein